MNRLLQVGETTWVDPETIQAIEWSEMSQCPKLLLSSGRYVLAISFKDNPSSSIKSSSEGWTDRLIEKITLVMRLPTKPTFSGRSA